MDGSISRADYEAVSEQLCLRLPEIIDGIWELQSTLEGSMLKHKELSVQNGHPYSIEVHILHSEVYRVPVLYFNVWSQNGKLLSASEIASLFQYADHSTHLALDLPTVLTQHEHPVLGKPWYFIHPCKTAQLLSKPQPRTPLRYMLCWLSILAPMAGLRLRIENLSIELYQTQQEYS